MACKPVSTISSHYLLSKAKQTTRVNTVTIQRVKGRALAFQDETSTWHDFRSFMSYCCWNLKGGREGRHLVVSCCYTHQPLILTFKLQTLWKAFHSHIIFFYQTNFQNNSINLDSHSILLSLHGSTELVDSRAWFWPFLAIFLPHIIWLFNKNSVKIKL